MDAARIRAGNDGPTERVFNQFPQELFGLAVAGEAIMAFGLGAVENPNSKQDATKEPRWQRQTRGYLGNTRKRYCWARSPRGTSNRLIKKPSRTRVRSKDESMTRPMAAETSR